MGRCDLFNGAISVGKSRMMTTSEGIQLGNNAFRQCRTDVQIILAPLKEIIFRKMAEWSIAADCKSVSLDAMVRIHLFLFAGVV